MAAGMKVELLSRRCSRDHVHVPIQGALTKPSAVYCDGLASALAAFFKDHLRAAELSTARLGLRCEGLEDQLTNDLCLSLHWKERASWRWKGSSHVNVLEAAATLKLYRDLAGQGGDVRFVYFGDSHVARSALARGRTSSFALRPLLKQASSLSIAYGLYGAGRYAPTRWNPADHPTRDSCLPPPVPGSIITGLSADELLWIGAIPRARRWASGWIRLTLLLAPQIIGFYFGSSFRPRNGVLTLIPPSVTQGKGLLRPLLSWFSFFGFRLSYLGFPPLGVSKGKPLILGVITGHLIPKCHGVSVPTATSGDLARQKARAGIKLEVGSPVTEGTRAVREDFFSKFDAWLQSAGF